MLKKVELGQIYGVTMDTNKISGILSLDLRNMTDKEIDSFREKE